VANKRGIFIPYQFPIIFKIGNHRRHTFLILVCEIKNVAIIRLKNKFIRIFINPYLILAIKTSMLTLTPSISCCVKILLFTDSSFSKKFVSINLISSIGKRFI
jgi:hypothetical protein